MLLQQVVEEIAGERDIQKITEDQYRRSQKSFSEYLGRNAKIEDLTPSNINQWVKSLQSSKSATTCANYLAGLLVIWNHLAERQLVDPYHTKRIRHIRRDHNPVVAWTIEEIRILMKSADLLEGVLRNTSIKASEFMRALILVSFETGLRPSDMRLIKIDQIDFKARTISIVQHKTRQPHVAKLSEPTIEAIKRLKTTDLVFPLGKTGVRKWEIKLYKIAEENFSFCRRKRSGIGTLRKSHATEIFTEFGLDVAARSLGHVGGVSTARLHYIDSRAINSGTLPGIDLNDRASRNSKGSPRRTPKMR